MAYIISILKRIWSFFFGSAETEAIDTVSKDSKEQVSIPQLDKANRRRKGDKRKSNYKWLRFFNTANKNLATKDQIALAKAHFGNFRPIQKFRVNHRVIKIKGVQ